MIETSQAYKDLMSSNVRPTCEPVIKATGINNNGNPFEVVWEAKDIINLTYKRGVDPLGRELPYMELSFTEIYNDVYDENDALYKYEDIPIYAKFELTFKQSLDFFNTWEVIKNAEYTWKMLKEKFDTWKNVKNEVPVEEIKLPTLFLEKKTIEDKTINWIAKDLLSFMGIPFKKMFYAYYYSNATNTKNALKFLLSEARASFLKENDILKAIEVTFSNIYELSATSVLNFMGICIIEGNVNSLMMNLLSLKNTWIDFHNDGSLIYTNHFEKSINQTFFNDIMYEFPKITSGKNVSSYVFYKYLNVENIEQSYIVTPEPYCEINKNQIYKVDFKGNGVAFSNYGSGTLMPSEPTYTLTLYEDDVVINPIETKKENIVMDTGLIGEVYNEDNIFNQHDSNDEVVWDKLNFIQSLLSSKLSNIEINALPNVALTPLDIISVETTFYEKSENDLKQFKTGYIKCIELEYNGVLKEKIKVGEYESF